MEGESEAMQAFAKRAKHVFSKECLDKALNFEPTPDTVMIVTPAKSGTSWIQQICHGLRTRGSMDFENLNLEIPFLEMAHDYGYTDLHKAQVSPPPMYVTHFHYPSCPKGAGKYVYLIRDPKDACVSGYHFMNGWMFEKDSVSIEDFILKVFVRKGAFAAVNESTNWQNIASWYPHRKDDNLLWLHFEDLKEDLPACVKLVAEFLDIGAEDEELQAMVTKQAGIDFMKKYSAQFDVGALSRKRNVELGLAADAAEGEPRKIRKGDVGEGKKVLPEHVLEALDGVWKEDVEPVTGYASYAEMRFGINKELDRPFASAA